MNSHTPMRSVLTFIPVVCSVILLNSCNSSNPAGKTTGQELATLPIVTTILNDPGSIYYINTADYPENEPGLPIGVFDSGTGGLTVLEAILTLDAFRNGDQMPGADSLADFIGEDFIYLADQANMPYGIYASEGKSDLLVEHIIKDAWFLLADKYYTDENSESHVTGKRPVKAIVIACNTATAYGGEYLTEFMSVAGLNIKVLGVIDAGVRGALSCFEKDEDGTIGIMATIGTVASKGYENTVIRLSHEMGFTGNLQVYSQGGHGIAEAVDGEADFIDRSLARPRTGYRGPSFSDSLYRIDRTLMDAYNFDFSANKMLCDSDEPNSCNEMQINDSENYIRFHLVSLLETMRVSPGSQPMKALILGCTHYPYLTAEIERVLDELYDYMIDGNYVYRHLLAPEVILVDPSVNVARELYEFLRDVSLLKEEDARSGRHEFYISIPNARNPNVQLDANRRFTYEYKYGRKAGEIQEYVRVVPFSAGNIPSETLDRLEKGTPLSFRAITEFSSSGR
jgi:glutamate racemase